MNRYWANDSVEDPRGIGIVDEEAGGIIAYANNGTHADDIVRRLNESAPSEHYTEEHARVAAIFKYQQLLQDMRPRKFYMEVARTKKIIHSLAVDIAVMYRDKDPDFDIARFYRESRG